MKEKISKFFKKEEKAKNGHTYYKKEEEKVVKKGDDGEPKKTKSLLTGIVREEKGEYEKQRNAFCVSMIEKFKTRRSIRKYSQKPVDWEIIFNLIEAGLNAPCAGGIQNTTIIVVSDKKKRDEIARIEDQQFWLTDAPYFLIVVRDNHRLMELYPGYGELYAVQNTASVIGNILMLAHCYDLGACWVESGENEVLKEYLGIPADRHVDAVIPIGFPLEKPEVMRDHVTTKMFFESFGNKKRKKAFFH